MDERISKQRRTLEPMEHQKIEQIIKNQQNRTQSQMLYNWPQYTHEFSQREEIKREGANKVVL